MKRTRVDFVELVPDSELRKKQREVTKVVNGFFPRCGPVKLYRTADGRIGFQMQVAVAAGERKKLDEVYRAVMRVLGEKRGRHRGVKTIQTKLHLPEPIYSVLKRVAEDSGSTMSNVVAESLRAKFHVSGR